MNNKTYDVLKYIALIALPALAVFYSTLSNIWNLPYHDAIPDTIMAVDLFLGALLGISNSNYKKMIDGVEEEEIEFIPDEEDEEVE